MSQHDATSACKRVQQLKFYYEKRSNNMYITTYCIRLCSDHADVCKGIVRDQILNIFVTNAHFIMILF